jgi:hypothetical protein
MKVGLPDDLHVKSNGFKCAKRRRREKTHEGKKKNGTFYRIASGRKRRLTAATANFALSRANQRIG